MAEHHHQSAVDQEIVCMCVSVGEMRNLLWERSVKITGGNLYQSVATLQMCEKG